MLKNYIKIAFRVMLRQKFFTGVSIFGISFTIMVCSIAAGLMSIIFGNAAPSVNHSRSLFFEQFKSEKNNKTVYTSPGKYFLNDVKKFKEVERLSMYITGFSFNSFTGGKKVDISTAFVDEEIFKIYKFNFREGRPFTHQEVAEGQSVCIISSAVRKFYFGDGTAVGKYLPTTPAFRIVGVVDGFTEIRGPGIEWAHLLIPLMRYRSMAKEATYAAVILAKHRSDFKKIKSQAKHLIEQEYNPSGGDITLTMNDLFEARDLRNMLAIFGTLAFFVMVIPAINLIGLNINRISERSSEIGIRKSFGASSSVLVWQFLTENLIITFTGGLLGVILTIFSSGIVMRILRGIDATFPSDYTLINWGVIIGAVFASFIFGIISGVLPALRMSKMEIVKALKGGDL